MGIISTNLSFIIWKKKSVFVVGYKCECCLLYDDHKSNASLLSVFIFYGDLKGRPWFLCILSEILKMCKTLKIAKI